MFGSKKHRYDIIDFFCMVCSMLVIFVMVFSLVLFTQNAYAGDTTDNIKVRVSPGPATLFVNAPTINVTVSYTGDDTANNSIKIEWGLDEDDFSLGTKTSPIHPASPYTTTAQWLDNSLTYKIKVTVTDPDNDPIMYEKIFTGLKSYNPLIHNAVSTGSTKWTLVGGWGIAGGQYGEFTCSVCHERRSGNIKRIRNNWSDDNLPNVPAKSHGDSIVFSSAIDGSAEYAVDDSTNHASSNRVCEACHTLTAHHKHNESLTPGTPDHNSTKACISCHKHQNGFAPTGCSGCHGGGMSGSSEDSFWPGNADETVDTESADDSGEHTIHMTRLAAQEYTLSLQALLDHNNSGEFQTALCAYCHPNPGGGTEHNRGDDVGEVNSFLKMDGSADGGAVGAYDTGLYTCSNVDCHNSKNVTAANNWYAGSDSHCLMCHTTSLSSPNTAASTDPASGLHLYNSAVANVEGHDDDFDSGSGDCLSCHSATPSDKHFDSAANTPATATYSFNNVSIDLKLGNLADNSDNTCAADCHRDSGEWYRLWSQDAFVDPTVAANQPLPASCNVCHGQFGTWAEGTSHAGTANSTASLVGKAHNSQDAGINPGAACEDCHVFPSRDDLHNDGNNKITLNDDDGAAALLPGDAVDAVYDDRGDGDVANDVVYCAPCHNTNDLPPSADSKAFPASTAFTTIERISGIHIPEGACYSGAAGCHGDASQRWWPSGDSEADGEIYESADPTPRTVVDKNYGYPNRVGAHIQHNITIGELVCETRQSLPRGGCSITDAFPANDPTDADYNNTCSFCHPMTNVAGTLQATNHVDGVVDLYGGSNFPGADKYGLVTGAEDPAIDSWNLYDAIAGAGYIYQLDDPTDPGNVAGGGYPLDTDGSYRQYLYDYRTDPDVNHGTCSNIACHSNSPFTPQWYGDEQAPGQILDLSAYTHMQNSATLGELHPDHNTYEWDEPGSVRLYWVAPGDNGVFSGTADEYDVFYRHDDDGAITTGNLLDANTKRAGGAPTVLRQSDQQEMMVQGLIPGDTYSFAVVTKDQPHYQDVINAGDGIYETLQAPANQSPLSNIQTAVAHSDDVMPIFWGLDKIKVHDAPGALNLSYLSAKDHSVPITYRIWYSTYSVKTHLAAGGDLTEVPQACYMSDDPTTDVLQAGSDYCIDSVTTKAIHLQIDDLAAGILYSFIARAYDTAGNHDDNTVVQLGMAQSAPREPIETQMYLVSNADTLLKQLDISDPQFPGADFIKTMTSSTTLVWETDFSLPRRSEVSGISFDIQVTNPKRFPIVLSVELGYMDPGFTRLGVLSDADVTDKAVSLGKKSTRVQKFSLSDYKGLVPADKKLALRLNRWDSSTSVTLTLTAGTSATKGQLLANVRPYNHPPNGTFAIVPNPPTLRPGGYIDIDWSDADPQDVGQTLHYDVYGSADGGATFPYVIATKIPDGYPGTITWDTVGDGLTEAYDCMVRVELGDGYVFEDPSSPNYPDPFDQKDAIDNTTIWSPHNGFNSDVIPVDNTEDVEPPAAITMYYAETRPKQGSVFLEWTAVGDDGLNHGTRVSYYDIRYRPDPVVNGALTESTWDTAPTTAIEGEPVPHFSGSVDKFELLGLAPEVTYDIGIKGCDEADNCSILESYSVKTAKGGPFYCGICHSTPPDEPDTRGVHREHGYTLVDCAKCHGDGTGTSDDVKTYDGRHYNGFIDVGWAKMSNGDHAPLVQLAAESGGGDVILTQTNNNGAVTIYQDLDDGAGGYNKGSGAVSTATANTDSGTCLNFGAANANGCHGPFQPQWAPSMANPAPPKPACADCHGDNNITGTRQEDPYGRTWDCNVNGDPSELVKASPPVANHDETGLNSKYTGAHERHLNASFRFAKGDSCRLCHLDTMYSGEHADGKVDIRFDDGANQSDTLTSLYNFDGPEATTGMSCGNLSTDSCHDTFEADGVTAKPLAEWPVWNVSGAKCESCHGMSTMASIPHISDGGVEQECIYCHLAGHPQSANGIDPGDVTALLVNNNPAVGINYKSGGIHMRKVIGDKTHLGNGDEIDTLAEMCWGCHEDQNPIISEWETNTAAMTGSSSYDYGSLDQSSWVGAVWNSAKPEFAYKTGYVQSIHTTDPSGTSAVTWDAANGRYNETVDPVSRIRCTNCHDVHDLNKAEGDTVSGAPFLRGTWKSNPYAEDGAPYDRTYTNILGFGDVPRGSTGYNQTGGYYIDQNNVRPGTTTSAKYPTSGWTVQSSAGLCVLCHGDDVDNMDILDPERGKADELLWLGTNGHSNSTLGGTFLNAVNIFDYTHGRPVPDPDGSAAESASSVDASQVVDMQMASKNEAIGLAGSNKVYGYRDTSKMTSLTPPSLSVLYGAGLVDWGATVDADSTDTMYHQFSCSKCHNPHASRLPKLLITNCLDIRHNTWDDVSSNSTTQDRFTNALNKPVDWEMPLAYFASAANCHRFDPARTGAARGGWNKVSPWVNNNLNDTEHKGGVDEAYKDTTPTNSFHEFELESTGW